MSRPSRFNPTSGVLDFWNEIRRPQPHRWLFVTISALPVALILYWAVGQVAYKVPDRPRITYITTFDPDRTDAEIAASNAANQELKELREAEEARIAQRKREMYKALGAATGMDVDTIEREADARRAAEQAAAEAERARRRAEMFPGGAPVAEGTAP